ncbi:MAG: aminoglycoside phosphotransferase family protein [Clostridia bacterium]|nr:aminoglycoside phosphotransferase family protein [Clostridia bacterium]
MAISDSFVKEILNAYDLPGTYTGHRVLNYGHINDTLVVELDEGDKVTGYILQRINTNVFKNAEELMENIESVTSFLAEKIRNNGGDPDRETLTVFHTKDGKSYHICENNDCWRIYNYVSHAHSLQFIEDPEDFRKSGEAFGKFQCMLSDYPSETLHETIPDFHNTVSRFSALLTAIEQNLSGRKDNVKEEIEFALQREKDTHILVDLLEKGKLPLRVTHNDTKLNNVMFDDDTGDGICVVDLDTVMPGLSLYDFGDSIRFGANTASEDEKDVSKVSLDLGLYEAYVKGYLGAAGESLTEEEIKYLPFSAKLMTYECGIRFLSDYLNGDTYFHTDYPEHNLVRARTQFALVADIERKYDEMCKITMKYAK